MDDSEHDADDDLDEDWDDPFLDPPAAREVASRLLALLIMDLRCGVEARFAAGQPEAVGTWDEAEGIVDAARAHLHPIEHRLLFDKEVGGWDAGLRRDVHWLIEGQVVMRWALGSIETFPPPDVMTKAGSLGPGPLIAPNSFLDAATLRPIEEIERVEVLCSFGFWRVQSGPFRGKRLLPPRVREAVERAVEVGLIEAEHLIEGDVAAFGLPVFRLDEEQQEILTSISTERCRAARWLSGHGEDFYEVDLDQVGFPDR